MRSISLNMRSRVVKMTLWGGTEDEQSFEVKCLKRGKPYVEAYGIKYYLTGKEARLAKTFLNL